jgi:hypothetical protein
VTIILEFINVVSSILPKIIKCKCNKCTGIS